MIQQDEILAGKGDARLPLAGGIVSELALNGAVPGTGAASQIAVQSLIETGRDRQVEDDFTVSGGEETAELRRIGNRVAVGQIEYETVGQDSGCKVEDSETVPH